MQQAGHGEIFIEQRPVDTVSVRGKFGAVTLGRSGAGKLGGTFFPWNRDAPVGQHEDQRFRYGLNPRRSDV